MFTNHLTPHTRTCDTTPVNAVINSENEMFYICVKPSERKRICSGGKIWVKDMQTDVYVAKKDRGEWRTKESARQHITEDCEIIVEEKDE